MRRVAAQSIVLLKNDGGLLPLRPQNLKKIAIIGGNAKAIVLSGGGSAALKASYFVSPYQGIVDALAANPDVEVTYSEGARGTISNVITREILLTKGCSVSDDAVARLRVIHRGREAWMDWFLAQSRR
jgi:beta-glucosidase-like glycosyl hydrolase